VNDPHLGHQPASHVAVAKLAFDPYRRTRLSRYDARLLGLMTTVFIRSETMLDVIFRGFGGLLVASVVGQFAAHAGMPAWQIGLMIVFVAIGLPMCLSGRLGNW
jgi:hypothetical protein